MPAAHTNTIFIQLPPRGNGFVSSPLFPEQFPCQGVRSRETAFLFLLCSVCQSVSVNRVRRLRPIEEFHQVANFIVRQFDLVPFLQTSENVAEHPIDREACPEVLPFVFKRYR